MLWQDTSVSGVLAASIFRVKHFLQCDNGAVCFGENAPRVYSVGMPLEKRGILVDAFRYFTQFLQELAGILRSARPVAILPRHDASVITIVENDFSFEAGKCLQLRQCR
jgi:hypothetical protein